MTYYFDHMINYQLDVWLYDDVATICEGTGSGLELSEPITGPGDLLRCGKKTDAICREWNICPSVNDFFDDYQEEAE